MRPAPTHPVALAFAAVILFTTSPSPALQPATRPATQPATPDTSADVPDFDDAFWPEPDAPAVLTTAAQVRALTPAQAAAARPVRLRGTVTYIGSYPPVLFVQDETGGVAVPGQRVLLVPDGNGRFVPLDPRDPDYREKRQVFRYGATVTVEGVTARGGEVAYVTSPDQSPVRVQVHSTPRVAAAHPPHPATVAQLATPALHGEILEVEAVVRSVRSVRTTPNAPPAAVLTLAQGDARAQAVFISKAAEAITPEQYVGAVVRVRGVFNAATFQRLPEVAANRLILRTARDLTIKTAAQPARAMPVSPIRSLADDESPDLPARCRVQGVVTLALPGSGMFVQDATGGVWVDTRPTAPEDGDPFQTAPPVRAGDGVDLVGFPGRRGASTALSDAAWHVTGAAAPPDAPLIPAGQALASEMDGRLVRINAMVLSVARIAGRTTLVLQSDERVFLARLVDAAAAPPAVREGSWVRVTGVCVQTPLDEALGAAATRPDAPATGAPANGGPNGPPSFHLLLASDDSVQVISPPGWWTLERVLVVCGVLAAVALASIAWVVALRRRVTRQTHLIREHLASRTLYEERVRIARDLHDSLEQDLLGITMQLNATEKLLTQPDRAKQSLQLAAAMVRRSQAETHRAVWDLREQRSGEGDLLTALRDAVAGLSPPREPTTGNGSGNGHERRPPPPGATGEAGGSGDRPPAGRGEGPIVTVRERGDPYPLPPKIENHLLRVALEAVTNAMKHARATKIDVALSFTPDHVEVSVTDNGRGFDADRPPPPSTGHFGLFGMKERAEKLGGQLTITSRPPAGGTEVQLVVPTNPAAAPGVSSAPDPILAH
jgi:signal transduction histidine kinase